MGTSRLAALAGLPPGDDLPAAIRKLALAQMDCAFALMLAVRMIQSGTSAEAEEATKVAAQAFDQAKDAFEMVAR